MKSLKELCIEKINVNNVGNIPFELQEYITYYNRVSSICKSHDLFEIRKNIKKIIKSSNSKKYEVLSNKYCELMNENKKFKAMVLIDEILKYSFENKNITMINIFLEKSPNLIGYVKNMCENKKYDYDFRMYIKNDLK